jgi:hypothetical protein
VVYRGNLVLGLALGEPERWVNAIRALTGHRPATTARPEPPIVSGFEIRRFRVVAGLILLLIVLMSTALPLFFTWMQSRVNKAPEAGAQSSAVLGARAS